jgi:hypothetical protein
MRRLDRDCIFDSAVGDDQPAREVDRVGDDKDLDTVSNDLTQLRMPLRPRAKDVSLSAE